MAKQFRFHLLAVALFALLISVSFCCSRLGAYADAVEASDSWPMYMRGPQRTGYSQSTAPSTNELKWFHNTTVEVVTSPVVANGRVIVGVYDGTVLALNSTTGEKLWSYDTGEGKRYFYISAAIGSGRVCISTVHSDNTRDTLYCLNVSTGELLWKYLAGLGDDITSSPLVSDGKVFFCEGHSIRCLNADDGSVIWNFIFNGPFTYVRSPPAILDDVLFVGSECVGLHAINASTGVEIWSYSGDFGSNAYDSSPVVYDGKVLFVMRQLLCFDAADGTLIWNASAGLSYGPYQPAVANGKVFIPAYVPRSNRIYKFQCFNASTGSLIWSMPMEPYISSSPAVADGKIFFGTKTGKLCCLDENTGSEIWSYQGSLEEEPFHDPAIVDGTVFVSCGANVHGVSDPRAGGVYAFGEKCSTNLTLSLDSETSLLGFKVTLSGTLESNGTAIGGASVLLSYSVTEGESWVDVTAAETAADGSYSAVWIPSATGTYLVRATWAQYSAYDKAVYAKGESLRMLSVRNFDEQNVFSVSSNSTLSALAFDSANRELSFTVTGENGTTGFVEVSIAKSLVANVADLKVFLDGASLDYTAESNGDSWVLYFVYAHSTHNVTVNLGAGTSIIWLIAAVVGAVIVGAFLLFYFKRGEK